MLPSIGSAEGAADKVTGRVDATKPAPPKMTTTAAAAATVNSVTGRRQTLTAVAGPGSVAATANSSVLPGADVMEAAGMTSGVVAVGLAVAARTTSRGPDEAIAGRRGEGRGWSARRRAMGCVSTMGTADEREATRRAHGTARRLGDCEAIEDPAAAAAAGGRFAGTRRCGSLTGDSGTLSAVLAPAARARVVPAMVGRTVDVLTPRALTVGARVVDALTIDAEGIDDRRFAKTREREGVKPGEAVIRDAAAGRGKPGSPSRPTGRRLLSIQSEGICDF